MWVIKLVSEKAMDRCGFPVGGTIYGSGKETRC